MLQGPFFYAGSNVLCNAVPSARSMLSCFGTYSEEASQATRKKNIALRDPGKPT